MGTGGLKAGGHEDSGTQGREDAGDRLRGCGALKDMGKQGAAGTWGTWGCGKPETREQGMQGPGDTGLVEGQKGPGDMGWGGKRDLGTQGGGRGKGDTGKGDHKDLGTQSRVVEGTRGTRTGLMWRTWRPRAGGTWGCRKAEQGGYEDKEPEARGYMGAWSTGVMGTPSGSRGSQKAEMTAEGAAVSPLSHPLGPGPGLFIALQHTGTLGAEASRPLPGPIASPRAPQLLP